VNTVSKNINNLLSRIHSYSLSKLHNNVVVNEDHITLVTDERKSMEHRWNEFRGKTKYLKKNLFQYHFVDPKSCMVCFWNLFFAPMVRVQQLAV